MEPAARLCLALCLAGVLPAPGERGLEGRGALGVRGGPGARSSVPWHTGTAGEGGSGRWGGGTGSHRAPPPLPAAGGSLGRGPGCTPAPPAPAPVSPGCRGAQGRLAYKLLHDLFANYSSALRPVEDTDRALNVTLQVTLSQIIDMVSARARHRALLPAAGSARPRADAQPPKPARLHSQSSPAALESAQTAFQTARFPPEPARPPRTPLSSAGHSERPLGRGPRAVGVAPGLEYSPMAPSPLGRTRGTRSSPPTCGSARPGWTLTSPGTRTATAASTASASPAATSGGPTSSSTTSGSRSVPPLPPGLGD